MSVPSRQAKVFAALLVSMTIGAIVLMTLGNNPPPAGAFCLNSYYQLDLVEKAISSRVAQRPSRWNRIEIYYSGTKAGNADQLASLAGSATPDDVDCHFCLCNGLGGGDGQIQATKKWQRQWSIIPAQSRPGASQTIRICIIADRKTALPTDFQIKRAEALIEQLSRKFDISPESICYPDDWL